MTRDKYWAWALLIAAAMLSIDGAMADDVTYIKAGSLFDSRNGEVTRNAVIEVAGDRIISVGGANTVIPNGANVVDLSSSFVLPGLSDSHTHGIDHLDFFFLAGYLLLLFY